MTIEQQVSSLELSKRLKELGVRQESVWYWELEPSGNSDYHLENRGLVLHVNRVSGGLYFSAFTVAELGEMLPARLDFNRTKHSAYRLAMEKQDTRWNIVYICADCHGRLCEPVLADTEADARAKMLIYLLENKLITL